METYSTFIRMTDSTNDLCSRVRFVNKVAPEGLQSPIKYAQMVIRALAEMIESVTKIRGDEMTHDLVGMNFVVQQSLMREKKWEKR